LLVIHLHPQKLSGRHQLQTCILPHNYTIKLLLKRHASYSQPHHLFLKNITSKQQHKIKNSITDANNHLKRIFPSFNLLNSEFHLGSMSGTVHTGVKVCRIDSEMSGLVERPWLQLMCCAICLLHGHNFGCWEEVRDRSEC